VERRQPPAFQGKGRETMRHLTFAAASLLAMLFVAACDNAGDDAEAPAAPQQTPPAAQ